MGGYRGGDVFAGGGMLVVSRHFRGLAAGICFAKVERRYTGAENKKPLHSGRDLVIHDGVWWIARCGSAEVSKWLVS